MEHLEKKSIIVLYEIRTPSLLQLRDQREKERAAETGIQRQRETKRQIQRARDRGGT